MWDARQPIRLSAGELCELQRAEEIIRSVEDSTSDDRLVHVLHAMADVLRRIIRGSPAGPPPPGITWLF